MNRERPLESYIKTCKLY